MSHGGLWPVFLVFFSLSVFFFFFVEAGLPGASASAAVGAWGRARGPAGARGGGGQVTAANRVGECTCALLVEVKENQRKVQVGTGVGRGGWGHGARGGRGMGGG